VNRAWEGWTGPRCGSTAGYAQHTVVRKEKACPDCYRAHLVYVRAWRFRTGKQSDPWRCDGCGSVFPDHTCHMQDVR
jgi:transposase-like protein